MHQQLEKERSISSVYYILQGKQSIQTIQDTHLFGLDDYFGVFKRLNKQQYMKNIQQLESHGYLQKQEMDNHFKVTEKGKRWLMKTKGLLKKYPMNGQRYHQSNQLFYSRLLLLVQVWTNAQHHNYSYIPMIEDKATENWVKQMYHHSKTKINYCLKTLFDELSSIFVHIEEDAVNVWVEQLTGYQWIGRTTYQLAQEYHKSTEDIHLVTTSVNHSILHQIEVAPLVYPLLTSIASVPNLDDQLTESSRKTATLFNKGYTLEEIAIKRKLKINTICDHVVEIALHHPDFPLESYVPVDIQAEIYSAVQQLGSFKLKLIKEKVSGDISYFDIRLVLACIQKERKKIDGEDN